MDELIEIGIARVIDLRHRAAPFDGAIMQHGHIIGDGAHAGHVVGDGHGGCAHFHHDFADQAVDHARHDRV